MDTKFPNYCDYEQKTKSPSNERYFGKHASSLQPQCPRDYFFWSTIIVLWVTIAVSLVIMSLASTARYYHEATDRVAFEAVKETKELKRMTSSEREAKSPRRESATADANLLKVLSSLQETIEALSREAAARREAA